MQSLPQSIPFQNKQRGLATKTKNPETSIKNPPKADTQMENSNVTEEPLNSSNGSLKTHREGPNTESGELDSKSKSNDVKGHNKAMANRYDKR
ncbi:hypothetical protein N7491_006247 [Penicillium cf. griseofulvum]|uniref:Uncharacterized protein n=1 Tax=Penicillium cf. griseofulvum TaxID=2972120 RepID=A0A9W9IX30_9EURO|nr:hypothetical protein N7472_010723 [Penicillium cf. griseofulvum]KAJ5429231.1 hypothetical protein N7491_006247 [Penicillium cf. griseofulvum]KAJ5436976.1 hypothetical protein N7445_007861 [Penicillium cf. griseofulvum]